MDFELSDEWFTESITLQRPTVIKDDLGGSRRVWADVLDSYVIPASIQPLSVMERASQGTRLLGVTHMIYTQSEPVFRRGDRVKSKRNSIYRVLGVRNELLFDSLWVTEAKEILR